MGRPRCYDCRFAERGAAGANGWPRLTCHRLPPQLIGENRVGFPTVLAGDWCGEFQPRPPRTEEQEA